MSRISFLLAFLPLALTFQVLPSHGPVSPSMRMPEKASTSNSSATALDSVPLVHHLPLAHVSSSQLNSTIAHLVFERFLQDSAGAALCDLCSTNWMFVISTGRSGSTTVMEMLNALPMVYMAGENGGILNELKDIYKTEIKDLMRKDSPVGTAWYHEQISPNRVYCAMQALTKAIMGEFQGLRLSDPSIIGFKEIRYENESDLNFLLEVFPCARFLVNTRRNTQEQSQSAFNSNKDHFDHLKSVATAWKSKHLNRAFELDLEDFTPARFNEMLQWMGVSGCTFTSVAHANSDGGYGADEDGINMSGTCEFGGFE